MSARTASEFLTRADELMQQRGAQYDKPAGERSMSRTVAAFNAIAGRDLTEAEGWLLLQTLKDVRQWQSPEFHRDSVAYAALKAEALAAARNENNGAWDGLGHPPVNSRVAYAILFGEQIVRGKGLVLTAKTSDLRPLEHNIRIRDDETLAEYNVRTCDCYPIKRKATK